MESSAAVPAPLLYAGAGSALLLGRKAAEYLIVPAILIGIAIIDSWVLLVEINR